MSDAKFWDNAAIRKFLSHTSEAEVQRQQLVFMLERFGGSKAATARELGVSVRTVYSRMREHGISRFYGQVAPQTHRQTDGLKYELLRGHVESALCWCKPELQHTDPLSDEQIWVHTAAAVAGDAAL